MFLWILKPSSDNIETLLNILADPIQLLWIPQISPVETYVNQQCLWGWSKIIPKKK